MLIAGIYDFSNWKNDFENFLNSNGYKPSVVKDYPKRIEKIINEEGITVEKLSSQIDHWIAEYKTGKYSNINKSRHYAPSSALMKFKDFYPTLCKNYTNNQRNGTTFGGLFGKDQSKIIF